jgi:dTDP-4-dehydrorhamnose reductase
MCVTGSGRLGRAVVAALGREHVATTALSRPEYDLDIENAAAAVIGRYRPAVVIHCAAWTAVDECARDPALAMRRNALAVGELARACAQSGARLVLISTNEVFGGDRKDGQGYVESDEPDPINAYGRSKLAGEREAAAAFARGGRRDLLIVRTAWLFGPPGNDFPSKIVAAADLLPADEPLKVVSDEIGSPTFTSDLADALVQLALRNAQGGIYHLVNAGHASRLDLARRVLGCCRPERRIVASKSHEFDRPSKPPAWSVLANTRAAAAGLTLRPWQAAIDAYAPSICAS